VAVTRGPKGYPGVPRPVLDFSWLHSLGIAPDTNLRVEFRQDMRPAYWWLFSALLGAGILVTSRLSRSRLGRAWRALREDEVAAESCGVNAMWTKTLAFAVSAAFGALAGACLASYNAFVDFRYFEFMTSVFVLCYIVLGGMGTVAGPLAGTAVLVALGELLRENPARLLAGLFGRWPAAQEWLLGVPWAPNMRMILYGIILIVVIRFRPEGLLPSRSRARELHEHDASGHADHDTLYDLRTRD
jgi:branched-chain amino acid transport system permease protein